MKRDICDNAGSIIEIEIYVIRIGKLEWCKSWDYVTNYFTYVDEGYIHCVANYFRKLWHVYRITIDLVLIYDNNSLHEINMDFAFRIII